MISEDARGIVEEHYLPKILAQLERAPDRFPHVTEGGRWTTSADGLWTGGFWVGQLWLLWHVTGNARIRAALEPMLERLERRKDEPEATFDLGFLDTYGFVLGHRLSGDRAYRDQALAAARRLCGMVEPISGLIVHRYPDRPAQVSTIIDVMMNLSLLWWAARETGEVAFGATARAHALKSLDWLQRPDGSCAQVADIDRDSGALAGIDTINGWSAESCWARGQAWAIYGSLLAWDATGMEQFRQAFERALTFFADHLPEDGLPPWDFAAPPDNAEVKDSSAAAIVLAALRRARALDLLPEGAGRLEARLLDGLLVAISRPDDDGVLGRSCHRFHLGSGIGGASVWGDYYLLEAVLGEPPV